MPKSSSFTAPEPVGKMLAGARSQCVIREHVRPRVRLRLRLVSSPRRSERSARQALTFPLRRRPSPGIARLRRSRRFRTGRDRTVIQGGCRPGLGEEPSAALVIRSEQRRKDFQRHHSIQLRIAGFPDDAHSAVPDLLDELVAPHRRPAAGGRDQRGVRPIRRRSRDARAPAAARASRKPVSSAHISASRTSRF